MIIYLQLDTRFQLLDVVYRPTNELNVFSVHLSHSYIPCLVSAVGDLGHDIWPWFANILDYHGKWNFDEHKVLLG